VILHEGAVAFAQVMGRDQVVDDARKAAELLIGQGQADRTEDPPAISRRRSVRPA
jgi:hypothetical protein